MAKRGRILRDPRQGPGLLMVEGRQYPFLMDRVWRSEVPATPNLVVDVDFDNQGNVNGITAVSQSQARNDEREPAPRRATLQSSFESWVSRSSIHLRLAPTAALLLCWLFLNAVSIHLPFFGRLDLTFWQALGYLNSDNLRQVTDITASPDAGGWGFLGILALTGPLLPLFRKGRWAHLAGILPLSFVTLVGFRIVAVMQSVLEPTMSGSYRSPDTQGMLHTVGLGLGVYLSTSLAIFFAVLSTKQFLAASKTRKGRFEGSAKAA
jgi:hypothetical protein